MRWAALLGRINAGVTLPMADLRAFLAARGMSEVATLLASGNAVFTSHEEDGPALERRLRAALAEAHGVDTGWFLRSHAELKAIVAANPFADAARERPAQLQVQVFANDVPAGCLAALRHDGTERLRAVGRELFVDYPDGIGRSKLPAAMARARFPDATARNWNTLGKLIEATA